MDFGRRNDRWFVVKPKRGGGGGCLFHKKSLVRRIVEFATPGTTLPLDHDKSTATTSATLTTISASCTWPGEMQQHQKISEGYLRSKKSYLLPKV